MPTRPATWRREKVGSFSTWAIRLARKVSPKSRASLMVWRAYDTGKMLSQAGGFTLIAKLRTWRRRFCAGKLNFV